MITRAKIIKFPVPYTFLSLLFVFFKNIMYICVIFNFKLIYNGSQNC
jgi:hypothetical protein